MTRLTAELTAQAEKQGIGGRILRKWAWDFPPDESHRQGFYWCPLKPPQFELPDVDNAIFLGVETAREKLAEIKQASHGHTLKLPEPEDKPVKHQRRRSNA